MAAVDWTEMGGGLAAASLKRGVTSGVTPPSGGGSFVYAFKSLDATPGVHGMLVNLAGFNPCAKGASARAALRRAIGGGGSAVFVLAALQGAGTASDLCYMLGLADGDPTHLVLRKGTPATGLPDAAVGVDGVLARSRDTFTPGTWVHVRLDLIANPNGDVILQCWRSDLAAHPVASPVWEPINGMGAFVDDPCQINSGSPPLIGGRVGFACWKGATAQRCYVDHFHPQRQA